MKVMHRIKIKSSALGGKRGLIDSGLPALVFLVVFNLSDKISIRYLGSANLIGLL
jgi:hypothetical protein